jgi:hypothetical protein
LLCSYPHAHFLVASRVTSLHQFRLLETMKSLVTSSTEWNSAIQSAKFRSYTHRRLETRARRKGTIVALVSGGYFYAPWSIGECALR